MSEELLSESNKPNQYNTARNVADLEVVEVTPRTSPDSDISSFWMKAWMVAVTGIAFAALVISIVPKSSPNTQARDGEKYIMLHGMPDPDSKTKCKLNSVEAFQWKEYESEERLTDEPKSLTMEQSGIYYVGMRGVRENGTLSCNTTLKWGDESRTFNCPWKVANGENRRGDLVMWQETICINAGDTVNLKSLPGAFRCREGQLLTLFVLLIKPGECSNG